MVIRRRAAPIALAILAACRPSAPPAAIDPVLSARVPPATIVLAGIDLDRLRASPLHAKLPAAARAFLDPYGNARYVLIAVAGAERGTEFLTIARGTVPGAIRLPIGLALSGAPNLIAAATAAHPPAAILASAESVAAVSPVWIAVRGGAALPLEGNLANVNNLLRDTQYVTLAVQPVDPAQLTLIAQCPSPETALRFEQSLRALVSLTIATSGHQPATAAMLQSIRIGRQERVVNVALSAPLDALAGLLF